MTTTWFITGVSSGFGREMAERLLKRGDRVAAIVRRPETVADFAAIYGERFWQTTLDLRDTASIAPVVDRAFGELGRIDVVVNNAGYGQFGALESLSDRQVSDQISINLLAPIHVARAALPHLRRQGGGRLIAMSSYGGQATHPGASLYHASKWGLEGFFESLAAEVAPFDIAVTIVEPGAARTGFRDAAGANLGTEMQAYARTQAGAVRAILTDPAREPNGDPARMAAAIIASVGRSPAPLRLVLGSDAYGMIEAALTQRLDDLRSQELTARSVDPVAD